MQNLEPPPYIPLLFRTQCRSQRGTVWRLFYLSRVLDILAGLLKKSNTSISPTKPKLTESARLLKSGSQIIFWSLSLNKTWNYLYYMFKAILFRIQNHVQNTESCFNLQILDVNPFLMSPLYCLNNQEWHKHVRCPLYKCQW